MTSNFDNNRPLVTRSLFRGSTSMDRKPHREGLDVVGQWADSFSRSVFGIARKVKAIAPTATTASRISPKP